MLQFLRKINSYISCRVLSDRIFVKKEYKNALGKSLNLKDPKTLNEKICWLKLYDRTRLHTICADKFTVRGYVKEKIGEDFLIPLLFHTECPSELKCDVLKEFPCIIKTNHDSGGGIVIRHIDDFDKEKVQKHFRKKLNTNYYYHSKEWQYKNIRPYIIVEKLILDLDGKIPRDYKFHCFHGKVEVIEVDFDRYENHKRNYYNTDWELLPFTWGTPYGNQTKVDNYKNKVAPPSKLSEMITIAEKLSLAFKYVRIDLYCVNKKIYFGEITFHHDSGKGKFEPEEFDLYYGNKLKLF